MAVGRKTGVAYMARVADKASHVARRAPRILMRQEVQRLGTSSTRNQPPARDNVIVSAHGSGFTRVARSLEQVEEFKKIGLVVRCIRVVISLNSD